MKEPGLVLPKKYFAATTNYYQRNGNEYKGLFLASKVEKCRNAKSADLL